MFDSNTGDGGGQRLWNKLLSIFDKGKDEVVRSSKVSKARLDLSSLRRERERVFERLGEEVYKRHKEKKFSLPGLDPFFTEIDSITLRLSSKERELKDLKGEDVQDVQAVPSIRPERRERPYPVKKEGSQEIHSLDNERVTAEAVESDKRPGKRDYRPRKKLSGAK